MSGYDYSYAMEEGLGILSSLISGIPSLVLTVASYVLTALALYAVAKRRGISKPWLAWIPVADAWLLGSISDQYRYVVKGQNKAKRKALLTLNIIMCVLYVVFFVVIVAMLVKMVSAFAYSYDEEQLVEALFKFLFMILGLALPMLGVSIAYQIIYFMALYDVYTSMDPGNNVLFLVLSIIFNVTEPFFLFFNRNKDLGMPPRRPEPVCIPPQEPWETENKDYL